MDTLSSNIKAEIESIKNKGLYKNERIIDSKQNAKIIVDNKSVINFCANNYLGLSSHPQLINAAKKGLENWGLGLSSVRFICGTQKIHKELENYRDKFNKSNDGIIKKWPRNYDLKGWLVKMKNGGKIKPHIHDYGWLSGSIYINVPPKININSGDLVVSLNDKQNEIPKNNIDKNSRIIEVVTGSLCLFPASLFHYTIPFKSNEDRIVLAFDIMSK